MIDYKDFILIEDKDGYIYPKYNIYCNNCGVSRGYIKPYKGCEERLCRSCGNKGEMSEKLLSRSYPSFHYEPRFPPNHTLCTPALKALPKESALPAVLR